MNTEKELKKATGLDIKDFVGKAIEGGWSLGSQSLYKFDSGAEGHISSILLEPSAWRAVGGVEEWGGSGVEVAKNKMMLFIINLWEYEDMTKNTHHKSTSSELDYNKVDHAHCWEQKQPPACGREDEHVICCLCGEERAQKDNIVDTFDVFIHNWCGEHAEHLLDKDENDGERFRQALKSYGEHCKQEGEGNAIRYLKEAKSAIAEAFDLIEWREARARQQGAQEEREKIMKMIWEEEGVDYRGTTWYKNLQDTNNT